MQALEGLIQIGGHQDPVIGGDPKECQEAYPDGDTEMGGPYLKERAQVLSPDFHVEKPGLLIKPEHDETTGPGNENAHEYHKCGRSGPKLQEENEEDDPYRAAHWTAKNLVSKNISLTAAVLWASISLILLAMVIYIGGVLVEEDWRDRPILFMDIVNFGIVSVFLVILLHLSQKLGIRLPKVPNPFARVLRGPAITSYNIVKGFSLRSSFLLIFLCLLSELYLFVDPIVLDIFINEAGWEMDKYSAVMGGVVIAFLMAGQLIGGFLGDRFGVREVAMIGFTLLALANAGLALLQGYWENTTIMVAYLCLRAIINGLAWISIISVSMRLTYSKAGGTQFTAYMSMFNLSGVIALSLTGKAIEIMDYISALYLGAALTLMTVIFLVFIDPDECDRVLEGRLGDEEDENYGGDLGEASEVWWEEGEPDVVSA